MSISKKIARSFVLPLAINLNLDKYFLKKTSKNCCVINFHGVRKNNNEVFNNRHIHYSEFEKIIIYLNKNYKIIPLSELFEIYRTKRKVEKKTIALTFDDGYKNNFDIALPILKKHNTPATFYIISQCLINDNFISWPDIIDVYKKNNKADISINNYIFKHPSYYNDELKSELHSYLKTCGNKTDILANQLLIGKNYLSEEIKKSPELLLTISSDNIIKYANEPLIEYGSHTKTHFCLEYLNYETTLMELKESKDVLESILGKSIKSLAFPDGSYTNETLRIAKEVGYDNMVAVNYRFNENNTNSDLLSRFTISNSTTFESNVLRLAREFEKYGF